MSSVVSVRDDYAPRFGREVLSLWTGGFASNYVAEAVQLPKGDGYMIRSEDGWSVRVTCETPRTDANFERVDAALVAAWLEGRGVTR